MSANATSVDLSVDIVSVGIIVNPASGTDVRRLVACGTVVGTQEKVNVIQRLLVGLDSAGVDRVYLMPDGFGISEAALARLPVKLTSARDRARFLDMPVENGPVDSTRAARQMHTLGVGCIIVLGGDGTNRMVAKGCGETPILPISTGTNNVVPYQVEGTVAGLAAGFVARYPENLTRVAYRSKWLDIRQDGKEPDLALVDVVVVEGEAVGSRAVWKPDTLRQVILTRGDPCATGFSSLGGFSRPVGPTEPRGLCFWLTPSSRGEWLSEPQMCQVAIPLAPGLMATLGVEDMRELAIGDSVTVCGGGRLLALDGEREIALQRGQSVRIFLRDDGPWLVDVFRALQEAAKQAAFVHWTNGRNQYR